VTVAVGHGKKAAKNIDAFLRNEVVEPKVNKDLATLEKLRLWFFADAAARTQNRLSLDERTGTFGEVTKGLETVDAQFEARRCFSCGNCFECDGCYGACPEDAIVKLGPGLGYKVNFDLCTGCGTCFDQCPVHAISLVPEPVGEATI
jgi:Pyruvate/2-oxoacid:ferredoxin oxidoreductase delta subunit